MRIEEEKMWTEAKYLYDVMGTLIPNKNVGGEKKNNKSKDKGIRRNVCNNE